jgi:hypothetical protein
VLVEHGLTDVGGLGNFVHRGPVIAIGNEHFLGRREQLCAALIAGQPRRSLSAACRDVR